MSKEEYKSRVYTDRPAYADYDSAAKFQAIQSIIAKRLKEHPHAICSYSGGADSDIMIDLIERTREIFNLPPVDYVFFNTGLEMKATKDHVRATAEKYGVKIRECRPKTNIVTASRKYGLPFVSKIMSAGLEGWQKKNIPLSIAEEYDKAWYKEKYNIRYSDAYEVYGLTRTGCCGCPISYKAVDDLELIRPYEPTLVKAAWNVFGKSYRYRQRYNEYKARRRAEERI